MAKADLEKEKRSPLHSTPGCVHPFAPPSLKMVAGSQPIPLVCVYLNPNMTRMKLYGAH